MNDRWRNGSDYEPCFWLKSFPVYATTLLVASQVLAMIGIAFLMATQNTGILSYFDFSVEKVLQGQVWRLITYPFINSPANLLFFALQMYFLFQFGRELERFLGHMRFLLLYGELILIAPIILIAESLFSHPDSYVGSDAINFGIFIAFVTLYPNVIVFFSLPIRWLAVILTGVYSLQYLASQHWQELAVFWGVCICAIFMIQRLCGRNMKFLSDWFNKMGNSARNRHSAQHLQSVKKPTPDFSNEESDEDEDVHASIDPLLDKIAQYGISSLTQKEKARLQRARESLLDKERRH